MRLFLAFTLLTSVAATGQSLPDSLIVTRITYVNNFTEEDGVIRTEKFSVLKKGSSYNLTGDRIARSKIQRLLSAMKTPANTDNFLTKNGIDTNWIKNHPNDLLHFYTREKLDWNEEQKKYIFKELANLQNYDEALDDYFSNGCCYTMHHSYKAQYIVRVFVDGRVTDDIKSRKYVWGYKMPWTNQSGDTVYNYEIERAVAAITGAKQNVKRPLKGNRLLGYLVSKIVDNNMQSLYQLSAYSYKKEIDELKSDFDVNYFGEVRGRGRYIWSEPKVVKIGLKNALMFDNVHLNFMATVRGNAIYPGDSIKKDYKEYISRIQSIRFISDYLKTNPKSRLDIYYFNNKGINDYNIESINKNPKEWVKHDKWVESLKWYEKHNIKPGFDTAESIKTSRQIYCGCNYRFERSFLEKAIFFEIHDTDNRASIWYLLPGNKVLLYLMDGSTVLNFKRSDFSDSKALGMLYPCVLFDLEGNRLEK